MQYREFGKTGAKISTLGFGAMRLPSNEVNGKTVYDYDESIKMIHRAYELGVNYFDTAPYYCDGESESIMGKAIKGFRDKIYLSTKNPIEDASGVNWRKRLEKSLKNLDTDYIDFYHMWGISWDDYIQKIDVKDGPMEAALKAKRDGVIKHICFSFHDKPENLFKLIDTGNFETVLCQYNLLDRSNEAAIDHAESQGLGVVIMGPVGGGRLGAPSQTIANVLPGKINSSAEIALRFVISNPGVTTALSGMSSMKMVEENAKIASNSSPLTIDEIKQINASMEENKKMADLYCTGCNYCMPCPHEVNIPLNFQLMNYHRVYGITDYARGEYAQIGKVDWMKGKNAESCTDCGICEDLCPQKLEIRKQLKETASVLGE
ncbi:MAG: aldo/keto reductase [Spirochaetaceae bacterium]|jgi:predicted aldo/keto reductase-like oxidoreductase|nr:aldo/keto reductase [Spirochaetaceae bacterium]